MPQKKYLVTRTAQERQHLTELLSAGERSARARALLKADRAKGGPARDDARIAEALGRRSRGAPSATTASTSATARPTCSWPPGR